MKQHWFWKIVDSPFGLFVTIMALFVVLIIVLFFALKEPMERLEREGIKHRIERIWEGTDNQNANPKNILGKTL